MTLVFVLNLLSVFSKSPLAEQKSTYSDKLEIEESKKESWWNMEKLPTEKGPFKHIDRLNIEQLQDLLDIDDGSAQIIEDFVLIFENIYHEKMPKIRVSADRLDLPELCKEMHSFKVSCHNVGALRASAIAKEIHHLASQPSVSREMLKQLIRYLEFELECALVEIRKYIRDSSRRAA